MTTDTEWKRGEWHQHDQSRTTRQFAHTTSFAGDKQEQIEGQFISVEFVVVNIFSKNIMLPS